VPNRARQAITLATAGALAATALAAAGAGPSRAASADGAKVPTVRLERTNLGMILVDRSGYTLYLFTRDRRRTDRCVPVSGCIGVWPALTTTRKPVAGPGVKRSLLGTIKYRGEVRQVTYAGHPLYGYSGDFGPRSTAYVGSYEYGGTWYAVTAAGKAAGSSGI
jgi:predicted lipoprotein with Yx(FWY)xxD motif